MEKFEEEAESGKFGYLPPDTLDFGGNDERPRVLKSGGQYSHRAMQHARNQEFKEAVADLLRDLMRPSLDETARDKLMSTMVSFLKKAEESRAKKLKDGDLADLFEVLEIDDTGNDNAELDMKALRRAYRELSVKYHPDKNPEAAQRFNDIRDAYEVLSDPVKTMLYDTGGMELVKMYDGNSDGIERMEDEEFHVDVTLEDLYKGTATNIKYSRRIVCRSCRLHPGLPRCHECRQCPAEVEEFPVWHDEDEYHVEEREIPSPEKCMQQSNQETPVTIEPGMLSGDKVLFPNMGTQLPQKVPGDLSVIVRMHEHPFFKRVGPHLQIWLEITLFEALMGFEREIIHLDGRIVRFGVPQGSVIGPDAGLEIAGEGMPLREDPSSFGKLLVKFKILFPKTMPSGDAAASTLKSLGLVPAGLRAERAEKGVLKASAPKSSPHTKEGEL